jgi:hypothetical protein
MLTAAGLTGTQWYPEAPAGTALPYAVLSEERSGADSMALGVGKPPAGTITVYVHRAGTIGAVEGEMVTVCAALLQSSTGLAIRSAEWERAELPHPGDTGDDVVGTITIAYGVT